MNADPKVQQRQTLRQRGICVVIPTYNNAGTIADVVVQTLQECRDVIVVNDGSTDHTSQLLHRIEGITIVEYAVNRGKGHAMKRGFQRALQMGFAYAITLDADGQHYPCDIAQLLAANRQHPGSLIIGSRRMEGIERSKGSDFANRFSNFWFYVQTGRRLPDTQSGYRLYPLRKLYGLSLLTARYEAELELLVFASWHGVQLVHVPVSVYYPPKEQRVSHFRPAKDFARISVLNTVLCILTVVYGLPLRLYRWLDTVGRTLYSLLFVLFFSFCVVTPIAWLCVRVCRNPREKQCRLHLLIYRAMRFVVLSHGIPGTTFSCKRSGETDFSRPAIIICNHQSRLDLACQLIFTPNIVFLTNEWVWNSPLYGFLIRNAEYYPVAEGIDALMPKLRSLVDRGYSIAVYPEGTRSEDCSIGRFHKGAFHIAEQLGLDIVPMVVYGPGKVLPKRSYYLRKGPIHIEVDAPVSRAQLEQMGDTKAQASYMRRWYQARYEQIANEIEQYV